MDQNPGIDILSWIRALMRRIWIILIVFIVGSVLAAAVAYVLPPVYESTAKILVESQQIPTDLAQSTVGQSAAERLQFIEQRLMTRRNLLDVIDKTGLFAGRPDLTLTEQVDLVRDATAIESLAFNPNNRGAALITAFTISYSASSPTIAARVANEFVTMALEQNIATRTTRANETYDFFRNEADSLASELLDLEAEIARYKEENKNALPDSFNFRMGELVSIEQRQFERDRRRTQLTEQRRAIEKFISDGIGMPGAAETPAQRQLAELRRALVEKRSVLSESHPEVVALKARIGALEAALTTEVAVAEGAPQTETVPGPTTSRAGLQLDMIGRELKLLDEQGQADAKRTEELKKSLAKTPQVEMALNAYQRRYANLQARYDTAVRKLALAEAGRRLEVNRQAERFDVIEQARVPTEPVAPKRLMIAGGGAAASLGFALCLALLLETINPAIRTSADLQRRLQLHPVVSVPYIHTRGERRRLALKWAIRLVLVIGGLALLLWAVDQYVVPLRVLWARALDKIGFETLVHMIRERLT